MLLSIYGLQADCPQWPQPAEAAETVGSWKNSFSTVRPAGAAENGCKETKNHYLPIRTRTQILSLFIQNLAVFLASEQNETGCLAICDEELSAIFSTTPLRSFRRPLLHSPLTCLYCVSRSSSQRWTNIVCRCGTNCATPWVELPTRSQAALWASSSRSTCWTWLR